MVCRYEKEEKVMSDLSIKKKCDRCGGTYALDGIVWPHILTSGELLLETATLCAMCSEGFTKFLKDNCALVEDCKKEKGELT